MTEISRVLIGWAVLIQVAEDLCLRKTLELERPWVLVRNDLPCPRAFDRLYAPAGLTILLALRLVAAVALIVAPHPVDAFVLIFGTWAWAIRWRGTFNGGSDAMTLIVLISVAIALVNPGYQFVAHAYVAAHLIMSFFVAGLAKVRRGEWRSGRAPRVFVTDAGLGLRVPRMFWLVMSWVTVAFEVTFPLAVLNPTWAILFTATGLAFHVANAYVFGLNRFLWVWAAAYPSLVYVAGLRS